MTNQDLQSYLQASRGQQLMNAPAISPEQYGAFQPQPLQLGMAPAQVQAGIQQANYAPIADVPVAATPVAAPQMEPAAVAPAQEAPKMYPYDAYEAARKKQMDTVAKGYQSASRYASMLPSGQAEAYMSGFKNYVENAFPKMPEFKDTEEAQNLKVQAPQLHKEISYVSKIYNELKEASKISDENEKVARLQSIVPKLIQSAATGSSEAMNQSDALYGAPELENFSSFVARQNSRGMLNNAALAIDYANLPANIKGLERIIKADPDAYIKKAMGVHNTLASATNGLIDNLAEQTSPKYVEKFGIKKSPLFSESEAMNPYDFAIKGATAPIQQAIGQGAQTYDDVFRMYKTKK